MKEIDFDELDRAVNSLMSTVPDDDTAQTEASNSLPEAPANLALQPDPAPVATSAPMPEPSTVQYPDPATEPSEANPQPQSDAPQEVGVAASSATPVAAPAARRGRFMDVKPSGGRDSRPPARGKVSRLGVALQPTTSAPVGTIDQPQTVETPVIEQPPKEPEVDLEQAMAMSGYEAVVSKPDVTPVLAEVESTQNPDDLGVSGAPIDEVEPLSSPFLPDAKVEKRPLGRPEPLQSSVDLAAELVSETPSTSFDDPISPNKDAQLPEQPLPAELSSDVLDIETDTVASSEEPMPQPEASPEIMAAGPNQPTTPSQPQTGPEANTGRILSSDSIPQQYKVQQPAEKPEEQANPIYDAQPLAHPASKKPGWIWIVAIILIILIGAGGGAAVYYLGLI